MKDLVVTPIGTYHSDAKEPYEAARQPLERIKTQGVILLEKGQQFEQALEGLEGFERIWLIYQFHHNTHWKPKVLPPRGSDHKVGVFATRAPYRPNQIGISCVKLLKVQGLQLTIEGADLLNETPILDIKPYLPYADAFPDANTGWLGTPEKYAVLFSEAARKKLSLLKELGVSQFEDFVLNQLEYDPTNADKKRVAPESATWILAYRTWRLRFELKEKEVHVLDIFSGYTPAEIADSCDPYKDKQIHRDFLKTLAE